MYYQNAIEEKEKAEYIAAKLKIDIKEVNQAAKECNYYGIDILRHKDHSYG